jgi:RNA polymerase sigma-70 factor (ECF subfamily)
VRSTAGSSDRRAEFEATCLAFTTTLYGAALRLTRRPEDARDVVQETLLRSYRTFHNFARGTNARAWLLRILYSVFVNRYRRERREAVVPLEEVPERHLADRRAHARWGGALDELYDREILCAVDALPPAFRSAVRLVDMQGLTYEEAAAVLGCAVGTVRSRLSRGRRGLAARLSHRAGRS